MDACSPLLKIFSSEFLACVGLLTTVKWLGILRLRFLGFFCGWLAGLWVNVAVRALFGVSAVFSVPHPSFRVGCCVLKNECLLRILAIFAI